MVEDRGKTLRSITRSVYIPSDHVELFKKAEYIATKLGINMNIAFIQGLALWMEKNEIPYRRKMKEESIRFLRTLEIELNEKKRDGDFTEEIKQLEHRIERAKEYIKRIDFQIQKLNDSPEERSVAAIDKIVRTILSHMPDTVVDVIMESDEIKDEIADHLRREYDEESRFYYGDEYPEGYDPY